MSRPVAPSSRWATVAVVAPLVVGLLGAVGLLGWRRDDAPPPWCRSVAGVGAAASDAVADDDLEAFQQRMVAALADLDVDQLLAELPASLARRLRPFRADLPKVFEGIGAGVPDAELDRLLTPDLVEVLSDVAVSYLETCVDR